MEFMEIKDEDGKMHLINPGHISAITEINGQCKINLMGQDYMLTAESLKEVKLHLMSFKHW
ncbi:hypothetical protein [Aquimarina sp. 2201CG5-10]|uniref:hypothetical protein n=1 Tax=Aquimarina callyspongiae TaxID=3098150 RepID=UPI002AB5948E|nr:hypothetical protein [Aquimarina sp. 2201CG5-10]MDY8136150.1 hypothetical protein [Aquimarina sp. 2201CG5-10]